MLSRNGGSVMLKPRSYQQEMLEEAMKQNVIVAMDTGSGKTLIAVLRIQEELKRCSPSQLVWFMAPSVALCHQQHQYLECHLPACQILLLCGDDDVDKWTEQRLWDGVLKDINIVVSTPQVLLDALTHGFVNLSRLSLMIYDEAHNGAKKSPMNQIMMYFYHPLHDNSSQALVPHILGLTASPVMNADVEALQVIEKNLNAVTKTPKRYRCEFLKHVHKPRLTVVTYSANSTDINVATSTLLKALNTAYVENDIMQDPHILELSNQKDVNSTVRLAKAVLKRDTYCTRQLKWLRNAAVEVYQQLGQWAADWYINACIAKLRQLTDKKQLLYFGLSAQEKDHLTQILEGIASSNLVQSVASLDDASSLSHKSLSLVQILVERYSRESVALIFVKQRAIAAALAQLLANHPATKSIFTIGSFVGGSSNSSRKSRISDLAEVKGQQDILDDFKSGKRNLVISTAVLEEGIDVPACNVVVCFDPPSNLVSYVQRRGRARQVDSHYVMFFSSTSSSVNQWDSLEAKMIEAYMDEERLIKEGLEEDNIDEIEGRTYCVESTQALLTLDNATSHLHHFCQTLGGTFIDLRPEFTISPDSKNELRKATVILPISVEPALRVATSERWWKTEKAAKKDAAFVAYLCLYKAGLINKNLLPLFGDEGEDSELGEVEFPRATATIVEQIKPWRELAHLWSTTTTVYATLIKVKLSNHEAVTMRMLLPVLPPMLDDIITLYWNEETEFFLSTEPVQSFTINATEISSAQRITRDLLTTIFSSRMDLQRSDFPVLFMPNSPFSEMDSWTKLTTGNRSGEDFFSAENHPETIGLIRDLGGGRYIFRSVFVAVTVDNGHAVPGQDVVDEDQFGRQVHVIKFPRRRDFLHPIPVDNGLRNTSYTTTINLPIKKCTVDKLPVKFTIFALFIPSILRCYEVRFVAETLRTTILAPIQYRDVDLVLTAICGSSARERSNYQRLEFLGDCVLKLCTSLHLMAAHPTWPESYLTRAKSRMVSNQTLAKAALDVGLDRFIILKSFTGLKWRPAYNEQLLSPQPEPTREMSTKILADVVEALIGAAFIDGTTSGELHLPAIGIDRAIQCIQLFYPQVSWRSLNSMHSLLQPTSHIPAHNPTHLAEVERLLSHTFTHKSLLLTALTHGSHISRDTVSSYQRLEFLGDAVLDYIITTHLFSHRPPLPHPKLHTLRTALVNADLLAFLCLSHHTTSSRLDIIPTSSDPAVFTTAPRQTTHHLWQFMLHASPAIASAQRAALALHTSLGPEITRALHSSPRYPWAALARANAPKFMSDIVESVLGAAYIDSNGDVTVCEGILRELGVMGYLERALRDGVACLHPKEEVGILVGVGAVGGTRVGGGKVGGGNADGGKVNGGNEEREGNNKDVAERRVQYVVTVGVDEEDGFGCELLVDGELVASVHGCPSRLAAETWAAERAVLGWEGRKCKEGGRKRARESERDEGEVEVDVDVEVEEEEEETADCW